MRLRPYFDTPKKQLKLVLLTAYRHDQRHIYMKNICVENRFYIAFRMVKALKWILLPFFKNPHLYAGERDREQRFIAYLLEKES